MKLDVEYLILDSQFLPRFQITHVRSKNGCEGSRVFWAAAIIAENNSVTGGIS